MEQLHEQPVDNYTQPSGETLEPPQGWRQTVKYLGPSVIISATIVGSGEIVLTASLGAAVGYTMMWWVLLSCWSKSILQAELARYVILSGDTYLRALNRAPGKLPGPRGKFSWTILLGMIAFIPGLTGLGGIIGGAGQAVVLVFPDLDPLLAVAILAGITALLLGSGSYWRLEKVMMAFVVLFTVTTMASAILMQSTQYATRLSDLASGFTFEFQFEYVVLALAAYGYTGVNSGEISSYSYWCVEKGYPARIGAFDDSPAWYARAHGWLRVLRTDIWITLAILTLATIPFYILGAGVLHAVGAQPSGTETIVVLSSMFTQTLGEWSLWIFAVGAFCILFSSSIAGVAGGGRYIPDYLMELGFLDRDRVDVRYKIIRGYGMLVPFVGLALYAGFQRPVLMVTIAASMAAIMLPVQSGMTLYLQKRRLPVAVQPGRLARGFLQVTFVFHLMMALAVIWFVVL
ncbi:MAG: manganese transport protein [Limisphaerales bacterium]|jgi:manganese transport protein